MTNKFVFKVTVTPDEGMGMDSAEVVKDQIEEALRNHGFDNGIDVAVELIPVRSHRMGNVRLKKKKPIKKKPTNKKPRAKKKQTSKPDVWTLDRVRALYDMGANTPTSNRLVKGGLTHAGEPHEWEWEGDPNMAPVCLGCNATGDYVERDDFMEEPFDIFEESF